MDKQIVPKNFSLGNKPRVDCLQEVTYCFTDAHCRRLCLNTTGSKCQNGICINSNVIHSELPLNECDASKGVVTFLAGNVALGNFMGICRSIDPGIASDDITTPNRMCTGGTINIDYTSQFPSARDCNCPTGFTQITLPATQQVRPYVACLPDAIANRLL